MGAAAIFFGSYAAYTMFGIMQAGSTLSWHLSGPIFSKEKDSTLFSGVSVAMVGLRGCIFPISRRDSLFKYQHLCSFYWE